MARFRVHFVGGGKLDVDASSADAARDIAAAKRPDTPISRVKAAKGPSRSPQYSFVRRHCWPDGTKETAADLAEWAQ